MQTGPGFANNSAMSQPEALFPSLTILSNWAERDWRRADGVQLDTLPHMQRLVVRTYQHAYEIFVRNGTTGDVLVRGGRFFQEFTEATITGSSLGGAFLKQFGVYAGLRVEFSIGGETLLTAPIFSISIANDEWSARSA
jgi:hypothetical protein